MPQDLVDFTILNNIKVRPGKVTDERQDRYEYEALLPLLCVETDAIVNYIKLYIRQAHWLDYFGRVPGEIRLSLMPMVCRGTALSVALDDYKDVDEALLKLCKTAGMELELDVPDPS